MNREMSVLLAACSPGCTTDADALPPWLRAPIEQMESQPPASPPLHVARYDYKGQAVYYVPARCCDIPSDLYDSSGIIVYHPDGGFTGHGDGRCVDFPATAMNKTILWRDQRGGA